MKKIYKNIRIHLITVEKKINLIYCKNKTVLLEQSYFKYVGNEAVNFYCSSTGSENMKVNKTNVNCITYRREYKATINF